jgi:hypothetical protein
VSSWPTKLKGEMGRSLLVLFVYSDLGFLVWAAPLVVRLGNGFYAVHFLVLCLFVPIPGYPICF